MDEQFNADRESASLLSHWKIDHTLDSVIFLAFNNGLCFSLYATSTEWMDLNLTLAAGASVAIEVVALSML